jgi:hypothetical protein
VNAYHPIVWISLGALVIAQATWIFRDASRRRESHAWLWGLFGLINVPSSLIIYVLVTRRGNTKCRGCRRSVPAELEVCPYCGSKKKVCSGDSC